MAKKLDTDKKKQEKKVTVASRLPARENSAKTPGFIKEAKKAASKERQKLSPETKDLLKDSADRRERKCDQETSPENLARLEREILVLELRVAGASIRQIVKHLKDTGIEASIGTVHQDLQNALNEKQETKGMLKEHWVDLELKAIRMMWFATFSYVVSNNNRLSVYEKIAAGQFILSLQNQRDKYLQITKREKADVDYKTAIAKFLGVDPSELPNGNE